MALKVWIQWVNIKHTMLFIMLIMGLSACSSGGSGGGTGNLSSITGIVINTQPELVEVSSANKGSFDASWLPASIGTTAATAVTYHIHVSTATTFTPSNATLKFQGVDVLSAHITGLLAATRYTVILVASTSSGYKSISPPLYVTTSSITSRLVAGVKTTTPTANQIVSVSPYQMVLTSSATTPQVGQFIVSSQNNGILRKVTGVTTSAGKTTVQTQSASLSQVVSAVNFSSAIKLKSVPATVAPTLLGVVLASSGNKGKNATWKWPQTHFSLASAPSTAQAKSFSAAGLMTGAVAKSRNNIDISVKKSSKVGGFSNFTGPATVGILTGTSGTVTLNANVTKDDRTWFKNTLIPIALCKVGIVSSELPSGKVSVAALAALTTKPVTLGNNNSYTAIRSANAALSINTSGVAARAAPYTVKLRLYTDEAQNGCKPRSTFSGWKEELDVEMKVYVVSTPNFPKKSKGVLTFNGAFSVKNDVTYTFDPTLEAEVKMNKTAGVVTSLQYARLESISRAELSQILTVKAAAAATLDVTKQLIAPRNFIKVYMVGSVPIVMSGTFSTDIRIQGNVTGALTATEELTFALEDMRYGVEYINGAWRTISNVRPTYELKISGNGTAQAHLTVTLLPKLTIKFYESAAGRLVVASYLNADAGIAGQVIADITPTAPTALTADYWLTQGQIGGGIDAYVMADFSILNKSIIQWPKKANTTDYTSFKKVALLPQTTIAGLPTLTATFDSAAKHPTDSRAFLIRGAAVDVANPLRALFGVGPASFITFSQWHPPLVASLNPPSSYSFLAPPQGANAGDVWISFNKAGSYTVRLGGNGSMGGWARQIAEVVVNITDTNSNGILDQWESKYGLVGATGAAIASADPDGDGKTNLQEFKLGTDPLVKNGTTPPVNVVDTVAPVVTVPANIIVTVAQGATTVAKSNTTITAFLKGATAIDNIGVVGIITNNAPASFPIGITTVTFTAKDAAGNIGTATATVTVKAATVVADTTPPWLTLIGAATVSVSQGQNYVDLGATAFDVVDGYVTALKTSTVNTSAIGTYTVTYNASDLSGNAAIPVVRTVNVVAATNPVVTTLNNGLVAYYPFDGYATDASGNGNNGTVFGGATYVKGAVGQGIKFNGVNSIGGTLNPDHVMVSNSNTLQFFTTMSVAYWVRIDGNMSQTSANCSGAAIASIHGTTVAKRGDRFGFTFDEYDLSSGFSINPWQGGKGLGALATSAFQQFRHIAYVINGQNVSVYVNGSLVKTGTGIIDFSTANLQDLYLGVAQNLNGACYKFWYPLDGVLDDVRIYNRTLSATEVLALAGGNLANQAPAPTAPKIITTVGVAGTSQIAANDPNFLDTHTYAVSTMAVNGTASVDSYGLVTYTPNAAYVGADSFVVTVTDNTGLSSAVTVNVTIDSFPTIGLVAYYPFDGYANDVSGNVRNGTVFGGVTYPAGVKGKAASFHNVNNPSFFTVNDYIQLPNITLSNSFAFTYSALFRSDAHVHNASIYSIGDNSNGIFFAHFVGPSGQSSFNFLNNSVGIAGAAIQLDLSDKAWHQIIVNVNNNLIEVYDKGVFVGSAILNQNMVFQNAPNYLALNQWYNGTAMSSRFNGMVDDLRIYNRALTATELSALTAANSVNQAPVPTAPAITSTGGVVSTSQIAPNDPNVADTHTYAVSTAAINGTALVDAVGLVTYTPNAGYVGADSFVVTVTDGRGLAGLLTVNATVN